MTMPASPFLNSQDCEAFKKTGSGFGLPKIRAFFPVFLLLQIITASPIFIWFSKFLQDTYEVWKTRHSLNSLARAAEPLQGSSCP
jgi:hypothetical protein